MLTPSQQRLRDHGVLRDADLSDELHYRIWQAKRGRFRKLPLPHMLTQEEELRYPFLALVRAGGVEPPCKPRDAQPLIKRLHRMRTEHGPLVLLSISHPHLDHLSLFRAQDRAAIVYGSMWAVTGFLGVYGKGVKAITTAVERGWVNPTHSHPVVPLEGLCRAFREKLRAAEQGQGGGVLLLPGVHGVIVGDTDVDLESLGGYLSKFPDQRALLPNDHPDHLALLEERAESMVCAPDQPKVKLAWYALNWRPGQRLRGT